MDGPSRLERDTMLWRLKSYGYGVRHSWVQILDLPLIRYVTLNDTLALGLSFLIFKMWIITFAIIN